MSPKIKSTKEWISQHKTKSVIIGIVVVLLGYLLYAHFTQTTAQTTYILGTAQKDTIVSSITGSGQVTANRTLDIKPKVSADVIYVAKKSGDTVQQGDLIAQLDTTDAEKSVRDAQANLESAQLALQKLQQPTDDVTLLQAQDALTQSNTALAKAYDDGFNNVSGAFIDLPTVLTGLDGILHNSDVNPATNQQRNIDFYGDAASQAENQANPGSAGKGMQYKNDAEAAYQKAKLAYDQNFTDYKNSSRDSDTTKIQSVIDETYQTSVLVADAVKSASNLIQYYQDETNSLNHTPVPKSTTQLNTLSGYTGTINGDVSNLSNTRTTIANDVADVPEKAASLKKLQDGADPLDVQSSQLDVTERQNALQDAKDTLDDYYIRAPFSGTLSKVDVNQGDSASSGSAIATIIANEQVADITLNEVDASKVKIGDNVTLTFDAIDGLTIAGKVAELDTVGTVTQGVVNYTATISFDSSDARIKSGMSVSASIITDIHADVLTVPTSAVKTSAAGSYVLVFDTPPVGADSTAATTKGVPSDVPPTQVPVETGLSDDTNIEITSGLTEGEQIVTRTIVPSSTTTTTSAPSLLGGGTGGARAAGGATRGIAR